MAIVGKTGNGRQRRQGNSQYAFAVSESMDPEGGLRLPADIDAWKTVWDA